MSTALQEIIRYLQSMIRYSLDMAVLDAGVGLNDRIRRHMGAPVTTGVVDISFILKSIDLGLPLNHLQRETLICMPCDVTWT